MCGIAGVLQQPANDTVKHMIEKISIGVDIVEINRFKQIPYEKKPNFYKKMFSSDEIDYCLRFKNSYMHFAAKFALKEALKKSITEKVDLLDIETDHENNKPIVKIKNNATYFFKTSISHDGDYAIAIVISEKSLK